MGEISRDERWTKMSAWRIHDAAGEWPIRAGHRFLVSAYQQVLDVVFGLTGADLLADPIDAAGYRDAVTSLFVEAVSVGGMTTVAQCSTGGPLRPIPATDWTSDRLLEALATGVVDLAIGRRTSPHWIFVREDEIALMLRVLSATDMLSDERDRDDTQALGAIILASMSAIADARSADGVRQAEAVIRLLIPSIRPEIHDHADRMRFATAAAAWLQKRFDEDPERLRTREGFEAEAINAFGHYVTGRVFEGIWRKAVEDERYRKRSEPGRRSAN